MSGNDSSYFEINGNVLSTINPLDYELKSSYIINIIASDNYGGTATEFTITVTDVFDEFVYSIEDNNAIITGLTTTGNNIKNSLDGNTITFPDTYNSYPVTRIEKSASSFYPSIHNMIIPSSVTIIVEEQFFYNFDMTDVTLPVSLTKIDTEAFHGCYDLTEITIPMNVNTLGLYAFYKSNLSNIIIDENNTNFAVDGRFICDINKTQIVTYIPYKDPLTSLSLIHI